MRAVTAARRNGWDNRPREIFPRSMPAALILARTKLIMGGPDRRVAMVFSSLSAVRRFLAGALVALPLVAAAAPAVAQSGDQGRFFRIGTGASGGTYFPIGGVIASAISNPPGARPCDKGGSCGVPGLIAVAQSTQGSVENVTRIEHGELESGLCQADLAYAAYYGLGPFAKRPLGKLRAIANLYREAVHIVVRADSDIRSVAQLKGRRVSVGEEGSGTLIDADAILAAYKLRRKDVQLQFLKPGQASDALREGRIDAFFMVAGWPVSTVAALAEAMPVRLVPVDADALPRLRQTHPFFGITEIPAGTYAGVPATDAVSMAAIWVASADLDEELVYGVTKALWEKSTRRLLDVGHPEGKEIRLETALDGLALPLHPGAERYYREAGMLK